MEEKERLTIEFFATLGDFAKTFDSVCDWFRGDKKTNYGELMLLITKKGNTLSQLLNRCIEGDCEMQSMKNALSVLEQRIPNHNDWYRNEYRDGFGVKVDAYDNEVTIADEVMAKAMEDNLKKSVKKLLAIIEQPEIERKSRIIREQLKAVRLSDEDIAEIESEQRALKELRGEDTTSPSSTLPDIEPIERQRSLTDNAVWWITKAMQNNKMVNIADTKTLEGLNIILDKTGRKLYERRSLNCTRTEIKSLKEFLQQLLDNIPEPKN